jgi:AraC family transcriptional regulator of adaptative response/methylated-DNA-[protein]-cysteine methyltransferase
MKPTASPPRESPHAPLIVAACRTIESSEQEPSLVQLAERAGLSRFHFQRLFKQHTGVTPRAYFKAHRARRLRDELGKRATVTDALYEAGYNSSGRFYEETTRVLGMTPTRFRARGNGETIRFAIGECSLGSILVASSDKGVCAITLSDDPNELIADLQHRFSKAELVGADAAYEELVAKVVGLVESPNGPFDLPLDIRGTAFQQKVWQALQKIPPGTTASYSEIAAQIGLPSAVRAVAGACAANSLAIAIPCHRVVRTDGNLSGYRWGVERKRALLLRESRVKR